MSQILTLLENSFRQILIYSKEPQDKIIEYTRNINDYLNLKNKNAITDNAKNIRKAATESFFALYKACVKRTLMDQKASIPVLLFLTFGYVSEAGMSEAQLNGLCQALNQKPADNVYTYFEWLKLIYNGKVMPSVNDFSIDYTKYVKELKKEKGLSLFEEEELLEDSIAKVDYELDNMFRSVMKMLSVSVFTFCPVLTSDEIYNTGSLIITKTEIHDELISIEDKDFSLFYRDYLYSDKYLKRGDIKTKIYPYIIMMPCAGDKCSMWQETEGADRQTPARFIVPAVFSGKLTDALYQVCGNYRWEICKRIQGMRWMDYVYKSLTSEFADYYSNYRNSNQLTSEQKQAVKSIMVKSRNSMKAAFTLEYVTYLNYESKGSLKLNKIARSLMFKYCPFKGEMIQSTLSLNPMYSLYIADQEKDFDTLAYQYKIMLNKYEKAGVPVPEELIEYETYINQGLLR